MVYLLFFLSGAAALIYEIVWSRQLGLYFGHTVHAAAIVLGAYFAGMALGYLLAGRLAPRLKRPLVGYGVAELIVACWVLLTPLLLKGLSSPALSATLNHPDPALQTTIRATATFLLLLPATIALGATLPFIAQHVSPAGAPHPARIALAYGWNTAGAFMGVVVATYVLILYLGVTNSGLLAALLSASCGVAAIVLARKTTAGTQPDRQWKKPQRGLGSTWYLLAGLSGFGTLAFQVLYTRMFALTFHNSTYTFGGVIAVFLLALAAASWWVARTGSLASARRGAALACLATGPLVLGSVMLFQRSTRLLPSEFSLGWLADPFAAYIGGTLLLSFGVLFLPVAAMGMVLPYCFTRLGASADGPASLVGKLTALNTVAAAAGALLANFLLLPTLGLWRSFTLLAILYLLMGVALLLYRQPRGILATTISLIAAASLATVAIAPRIQLPVALSIGQAPLYQCETAYGVISVVDYLGHLCLQQDNHYTLGATNGLESELRQGHIPLLLHPAPTRVAFLGLATGITASSALQHPQVEELTSIELIAEVVEAAELFSEANRDVLGDQRSEIVINDARHYILASDEKFDVVIGDLFVPWHSQTGYLYTVEHYQAVRERLAEGGMFCQWVPLYQVGAREFELIADSFAEVFPVTTLWRGEYYSSTGLMLLVGGEQPLSVDVGKLEARAVQLNLRDSRAPFAGAEEVLGMYVGSWEARNPGYLNTDSHPRVEFLAPMTQAEGSWLNGRLLIDYYEAVLMELPLAGVRLRQEPGAQAINLALGRQAQLEQLILVNTTP